MDDDELIDDNDDESIDEVSETEDSLKVIARMYKSVVDKITDRNQLPFLGLVRRRRINKLKRKYAIVRAFRTDYLNDLFKSELEIEAAVNRDRVNILIQALSSINPFGRSKRKRRIPQVGNS